MVGIKTESLKTIDLLHRWAPGMAALGIKPGEVEMGAECRVTPIPLLLLRAPLVSVSNSLSLDC